MEGDRYVLQYGNRRVGDVVERASLGSEARGTITYDPGLPAADPRLARFVAVMTSMWRHADAGEGHDQEAAATELDAGFADLVESAEWRLVVGDGRSRSIHCPDLREGRVDWCWAEGETPDHGGAGGRRS